MSEEKFSPQPIPIEQFDESIDDDEEEEEEEENRVTANASYTASPKEEADKVEVVEVVAVKEEPDVSTGPNGETEMIDPNIVLSVSPEPMDSQMNDDEMAIIRNKDKEISELRKQISQLMSEFPPEIRDIDVLTSSHVLELVEPIVHRPAAENAEKAQGDASERINLNFTEKLLVNDLPTGMPWDAWPLLQYLDKNMTPPNESLNSPLGTSEKKSSKKLPSSDMCIFGKKPLEMPLDLCTCVSADKIHSNPEKGTPLYLLSKDADLLSKKQRGAKPSDQIDLLSKQNQLAIGPKGKCGVNKQADLLPGVKSSNVLGLHNIKSCGASKYTKQGSKRKSVITDKSLIKFLNTSDSFIKVIQKMQYNQYQQLDDYYKPLVKSNILKRIYTNCFPKQYSGASGVQTSASKSSPRRGQSTTGNNEMMQKQSVAAQRGPMCATTPGGSTAIEVTQGAMPGKTMIGSQMTIKPEAKKTKRASRKKSSSKSTKAGGEQQVIVQQKIPQVVQTAQPQGQPQQIAPQSLSPALSTIGMQMNKIQGQIGVQYQAPLSPQPPFGLQQHSPQPQQLGSNNNNFYPLQRSPQQNIQPQKMQFSPQQQQILMHQPKPQQSLRQSGYVNHIQTPQPQQHQMQPQQQPQQQQQHQIGGSRIAITQGTTAMMAGQQAAHLIGGPRLQQMPTSGQLPKQWGQVKTEK